MIIYVIKEMNDTIPLSQDVTVGYSVYEDEAKKIVADLNEAVNRERYYFRTAQTLDGYTVNCIKNLILGKCEEVQDDHS